MSGIGSVVEALAKLPKRRVVLHFDINRTIIQSDAATGQTLDRVLNANVSSVVEGVVDTAAKTWAALSDPETLLAAATAPDQTVMPYDDFVDDVLLPKPPTLASLPAEERKEQWKALSAQRRELKACFTHAGKPGEKYARHVDVLQRRMMRPTTDATQPPSTWSIIPSFFRCVTALCESGWPVTVLFRTFGKDLPDIMEEFALFLDGKHTYAASDAVRAAFGTQGHGGLGCVYRPGDTEMFLAWGTGDIPDTLIAADGLAKLAESAEAPPTATTYAQFYRDVVLQRCCAPASGASGFLALRDHYGYWAAHAEHASAGKIFVAQRSAEPSIPYQVFFDDNINTGNLARSIVDARDAVSGETLSQAEQDRYLVHVSPYHAIRDDDYFLGHVAECILRQQA